MAKSTNTTNLPTRRAVLTGAAVAASLIAVPAVIAAAEPASAGAVEVTLEQLEAEMHRHEAALSANNREWSRIEDELPDWAVSGWPRPLPKEPMFNGLRHCVDRLGGIRLQTIREHNRQTESFVAGWRSPELTAEESARHKAEWERRRAEGRARVRWWIAKRKEQIELRAPLDRLEEEEQEILQRIEAVEQMILATPGRTAAGIAVKLRVDRKLRIIIEDKSEDELDLADRFLLSALKDVERLAKNS